MEAWKLIAGAVLASIAVSAAALFALMTAHNPGWQDWRRRMKERLPWL